MSELYFRLGETKGFTAIDLADKKEGYANPIRELLQNSLDASREAGNSKCEINVYIERIQKSQIPHIGEYERVLEKAIQTARNRGSYNTNSEQRVKPIQGALNEETLKVLLFSDNGAGMRQEQLEAILTGGVSIKEDEKSGGSFGVGNLSSYSLSSLRYVLYATKHKDKRNGTNCLFTGSPILAGHNDGKAQRGNRGRIVRKRPKNEMNPTFVYPDKFPGFIERKMNNLSMGTLVTILGLSEDWGEEAEYAIVSNFFHAIAHDTLVINVHQESDQKAISYDEVDRLVASKKDFKRARGESILSGKTVYQAWQTVKENNTQRIIELSNSDRVYVCIKSDRNSNPAIVLIRNGMVIARHDSMLSPDMDALRKNPSLEPFTAVIDVDKQDAPNLFRLVKDAESPYHNRLQAKILGNEEEKSLKKLLKELSEEIKKHLKIIERDSFVLPLFTVPNKAKAQAGGDNKSSGQDDKAKPHRTPKPPKPKPPESGPKPGPQPKPPVVIIRNLESKNAVRYTDEGDKWKVRLRIIPVNQEDSRDEVYLSMCLSEDNDNEETKTYLDFIEVEINGKTIEIPESIDLKKDEKMIQAPANRSQVKLGPLDQARQYNITAEVRKPNEIGGMKVALLPILGLRQRKKAKE